MAFQFRLQKLLDYREDEKNAAAEELGRRQRSFWRSRKSWKGCSRMSRG